MPLGLPNSERLTGGYPFEETPAGAFLSEPAEIDAPC